MAEYRIVRKCLRKNDSICVELRLGAPARSRKRLTKPSTRRKRAGRGLHYAYASVKCAGKRAAEQERIKKCCTIKIRVSNQSYTNQT